MHRKNTYVQVTNITCHYKCMNSFSLVNVVRSCRLSEEVVVVGRVPRVHISGLHVPLVACRVLLSCSCCRGCCSCSLFSYSCRQWVRSRWGLGRVLGVGSLEGCLSWRGRHGGLLSVVPPGRWAALVGRGQLSRRGGVPPRCAEGCVG